MKASLPPAYLHYSFALNGCPIGKLSVGLDVLPSPKPYVSPELCSLGEIGESFADAGEAIVDTVTSCFGLC